MSEETKTVPEKPVNKTLSVPSPILILACILFLSAVASYIIPAGIFDRVKDAASGRMVVDPNTFHFIKQHPVGIFEAFMSIPKGIKGASEIVGFLMIIGGALNVMAATGTIHAAMGHVVRKMAGREILMVPVIITVFSMLSSFAGCSEEYIAFLPLILSVSYALGFDSITAVALVLASVGTGYGAGVTNAFTVGVAQSIAGLPMFSAIQVRMVMLVILILVSITYVMHYARKVKKNPESSPMYELDKIYKEKLNIEEDENAHVALTKRHTLVLVGFVATICAVLVGVIKFGFYIEELAALFLMLSVYAGVVGGLSPKGYSDAFVAGVKNMALPCLMVSMCRGVTIIMTDSKILDTIIFYLAGALNLLPHYLMGFGMFIVQDLFNIVVPSGSGQAAITMPIMAPLADLVGMTRQSAVMAFQMGDAFTNCITPASGTTMTILTIAGVPLKKWWKFAVPMVGLWWIVAFGVMSYCTAVKLGPF